jgi:hypothetical protein
MPHLWSETHCPNFRSSIEGLAYSLPRVSAVMVATPNPTLHPIRGFIYRRGFQSAFETCATSRYSSRMMIKGLAQSPFPGPL